jgi:exopolysaccharide biosynthesis polyprenyl glycosylphosphotransferase
MITGWQRTLKRFIDIIVACFALLITLPLLGIIAILVKMDSKGPVFYFQQRVGEGGKLFTIYKIRTMIPETEMSANVVKKCPDDPRITRVGRFLRRTSLDELPQLINVLKGDMSLVGPRPELPYLLEMYEDWQFHRLSVPQGMTGWWQINGRANRPLRLATSDDLYYVENYSLLLDFYILFKTPWAVVWGRGAY